MRTLWFVIAMGISLLGEAAVIPQVSDQVLSTVEPFEFKMGEPVTWEFKIVTSPNAQVIWPVLKDTTSKGWKVISVGAIDTSFENDVRSLTQKITVTRFDTVMEELKGLPFVIEGDTVHSAAHLLSLIPTELTGEDYHGLKPIEDAPFNWGNFFFWFSIVSAIGIGGLLAYYHLFAKPAKEEAEQIIQSHLSAWERAFRRLEKLEMKRSPNMVQKPFYAVLTSILKEYMEEVTEYPAVESTSAELMAFLSKMRITVELYNRVEELLRDADSVKFAKGELAFEEHEKHIQTVRQFIQFVRPEPVIEEAHVS